MIGECSATCGEGVRHNVRVKLVTEEFGGSCDGFANEVENCNNGECPARKIIFPCIMCICKKSGSKKHILIFNKCIP